MQLHLRCGQRDHTDENVDGQVDVDDQVDVELGATLRVNERKANQLRENAQHRILAATRNDNIGDNNGIVPTPEEGERPMWGPIPSILRTREP